MIKVCAICEEMAALPVTEACAYDLKIAQISFGIKIVKHTTLITVNTIRRHALRRHGQLGLS